MSTTVLSDDGPLFALGHSPILAGSSNGSSNLGGNHVNPHLLANNSDFNHWSERDLADVLNIIEQQAPVLERVSSTPLPYPAKGAPHRSLSLHVPQSAPDLLALHDDQLLREDELLRHHTQQFYTAAQTPHFLLPVNAQHTPYPPQHAQLHQIVNTLKAKGLQPPQGAYSESTANANPNGGHTGHTSSSGPDSPSAPQTGGKPSKAKTRRAQASHRVIEKQRRDRINTLMDELRDLVVPKSELTGTSAEDKRPMHTVLSDAITQLRALQHQVLQSNSEVHRLQLQMSRLQTLQHMKTEDSCTQSQLPAHCFGNAPPAPASQPMPCGRPWESVPGDDMFDLPDVRPMGQVRHHASSADMSVLESSCTRMQPAMHPDMGWLPSMPSTGPVWNHGSDAMHTASAANVVVEQGVDCLYVKLSCKGKPSLLNDISSTLRSLPVEIRAASISTMPDGSVCDELRVVPAMEGVTMQDLQCRLATALYAHLDTKPSGGTPKKRRTSR